MRVVEVEVGQTMELRRAALRPNIGVGETGPGVFHLGADDDGVLVGVATFIPTGDAEVQLRYMAVDPARQGEGVGRLLLDAAVARLRAAGVTRLWCNARDTAVPFYERLGWTVSGPGFMHAESGLPHTPMELALSRK